MKPEYELKHIEKTIKANELWLTQGSWKQLLLFGLFFGVFMTAIMYTIELQESGNDFDVFIAFKQFCLYFIAGVASLIATRLFTKLHIARQKKKIAKLKDNQ